MALPTTLFELGAVPYDWMTRHPAWFNHCAEMANHFPAGEAGKPRLILDLGCGPGVSALALASVCPKDTVVGLDYSQFMINRAIRHDAGRQCGWVRGDAHRLPFPDGVADAVTGHSFLYLLSDRETALQEIRRILKPQGVLVLLEPTRQSLLADGVAVARALSSWGPKLAFTMAAWRVAARTSGAFERGTLTGLLQKKGLSVVQVTHALHGLGWLAVARPLGVENRKL